MGSEGRKEVKISLFETTRIPLPNVEVQKKIVNSWCELEEARRNIEQQMKKEESDKIKYSTKVQLPKLGTYYFFFYLRFVNYHFLPVCLV